MLLLVSFPQVWLKNGTGGTRWKRCTVPWTENLEPNQTTDNDDGEWYMDVYGFILFMRPESWEWEIMRNLCTVFKWPDCPLSLAAHGICLSKCSPFQIPSTFWIVKWRQIQSNDDNFYETMTTSMKRWRFYERMTTFMELWRLLESWQLLCNSYIDKTWWNL